MGTLKSAVEEKKQTKVISYYHFPKNRNSSLQTWNASEELQLQPAQNFQL